jgi:HlyD family secretion protein
VPVDLVEVVRAPLSVTIDADGQTRIRDLYEVASPIAGTARRAPVAVGDRVVAGQTVVAMVEPVSPALLDARSRAQAEASVAEARQRSTSRAPTSAAPRRKRPSPGCNSTAPRRS